MGQSVADFDFDMPRAILEQLAEAFRKLPVGKLDLATLSGVADRQGVYQLYVCNKLVYLGKADSDLKSRLTRHFYTLKGRAGLKIEDCGFKGLYLHDNWAASLHEANMLRLYRGEAAWNNSGFGSNDPGRNRDTTEYPDDAFDVVYPIDLDVPTSLKAGDYDLWQLLGALKDDAPYVFRFETGPTRGKPHADYAKLLVNLPRDGMTFREVLLAVCKKLPKGWQATAIPSRVILYKETGRAYPRGSVLWPCD